MQGIHTSSASGRLTSTPDTMISFMVELAMAKTLDASSILINQSMTTRY